MTTLLAKALAQEVKGRKIGLHQYNDEELELVIARCKGIVTSGKVNMVIPDDVGIQPFLIGALKWGVEKDKLILKK